MITTKEFDFKKLYLAYTLCRKNKRNTLNALKFELSAEKKLLRLEKRLKTQTYKPGRSICFVVTEPKIREIFAADFEDRIAHHLLVKYLEPIWESKFIYHSYACRKNKGAVRAVLDLKKTLKKRFLFSGYYLQIDIRAFFMSIDKKILFALIQKKLKNPSLLWLTQKIIFHNPIENFFKKGQLELFDLLPRNKSLFHTPPLRGLPIGNLISQFFANVYLNEIDQYIKHTLKAENYFRYVDDMVLLHKNPRQLRAWSDKIDVFLQKKLNLALHPEKTVLKPVKTGINFVGYIVKPQYTLVRNRTVKKFKNKLWKFNQKILTTNPVQPIRLWTPELRLEFQKMLAVINSYYGVFKHADTFKLRRHLYEKHFNILKIYLAPANEDFDYFIWIKAP